MSRTLDLGTRVELVPMDPHCADITLALYEQPGGAAPEYRVHSYSGKPGAAERVEAVALRTAALAGAERAAGRLRFACGAGHLLAIRRAFLEACKAAPESAVAVRPLELTDKKLGRIVRAERAGGGVYDLGAEGPAEEWASRVEQIAAGLRKLGGLEELAGAPCRVRFGCGTDHDAVVGLLLPRALNVRASLREIELAAARGVLAPPSAQE